MKSVYQNYCKGQIVIIVAISLIVLIGMVGLAIDSGRGYGVKAKLSAAVDAAAIAAGRALAEGATDAERLANARIAAQKFFYENFPDNYLGAIPVALSTDAFHNPDGYWQVTVSASADMPTTFMRVLGQNLVTVIAVGEAIRRDVDVMLVMDTSGSLGPPTSPADTLPKLKLCAKNAFVSKFIAGTGGDRLGLVSFASGAILDVPINKNSTRGFNKTQLNNAIDALTVTGSTASAEGMRRALNEINAIPASLRSSLRAIVFFSDGAPNGVPATFTRTSGSPNPVTGDLYSEIGSGGAPSNFYRSDQRDNLLGTHSNIVRLPNTGFMITGVGNIPLASYNNMRTLTGTPYTNSRCNVNKAARNMVENVANTARTQNIYIHSASLGRRVDSLEINFCGYGANEFGANILKRLANTTDSVPYNPTQFSGIYASASTIEECDAAFSKIASEILRLTM